ncbi:MAG: NhaA family Na+:H+ antiporter [Gammaproteobacteria bacterium]|jgi:NhaA family Na+:H+ antiporter
MNMLKDFFKLEAASGILLVLTAILAMIIANSPLDYLYALFLDLPVEIRVGPLLIAKPLLLWINDGLMAIFFFLVGLELKREIMEGELSDSSSIVLPAMGALGGMAVPAIIYAWINWGDAIAIKGWAIPAATDIAFALGILLLLGDRISTSLKIFLVSIAIIDDIGAIVIIALFYTSDLSLNALFIGLSFIPVLYILNRKNVTSVMPYIFVGLIMWTAVLKSGVHATLAGVLVAFFIPIKSNENPERSPLKELEHDLHTVVAFGVLPVFAFANAGISLEGVGIDYVLHPVPLGIAAGLFVGKQLGVFGFCWIGLRLGLASLPKGLDLVHLYGVSLLCGVGFTMSLFVGSLAFEETGVNILFDERLGIIIGSVLSGVSGYFILRWRINSNKNNIAESLR